MDNEIFSYENQEYRDESEEMLGRLSIIYGGRLLISGVSTGDLTLLHMRCQLHDELVWCC